MAITTASQSQLGQDTAKNSQIVTTSVKLVNSGASTGPSISSIVVTDSGYNNLDDTAAATSNSYIRILGTGFTSTANVFLNGTMIPKANVTFVSSSELRAALPVSNTGNYAVSVYNSNSAGALHSSSFTISTMPQWLTSTTLANTISNVAFSNTVSATSDSPVTYSNTTILPTGFNLLSNGYYYGNISVGVATTYSFDIKATDAENQDTTRTFSLATSIGVPDPYWNNVSLLLQNGSTTDRSSLNHTASVTGVTSSTGQIKFGSNSLYFDGSSHLRFSKTSAFQFGTGDFTIEVWVYATSFPNTPYDAIFAYNPNNDWDYSSGGALVLSGRSYHLKTIGASNFSPAPNTGAWRHYAVVRNGSFVTVYVDGTQVQQQTSSANYDASGDNQIGIGVFDRVTGAPPGRFFWNGYMDQFRITKGVARYTSNFTPPTTAFPTY